MSNDNNNHVVQSQLTYFDAHSDIPSNVVEDRANGRNGVIAKDFLPAMREGGIEYRVAAIQVGDSYLPEQGLRRALEMISAFVKDVDETPELEVVTSSTELSNSEAGVDCQFILGLEGAEPLMGSLSLIDIFHQLGVRLVTLTHSRRNAVGEGCFYEKKRSGQPGGLSPFGVNVVERLVERNIIVDVSHLNTPGFWDVVEYAQAPFVASHSNCMAVHEHPRNITDEQIRAVADAGGVVGLTPVANFVGPENPTREDFIDHVEHAVEVAGIEHVGFGFDFFEYMAKHRQGWSRKDPPFGGTAEGIGGDAKVKSLFSSLSDRDFSDDDIERLARKNFLRLFMNTLPH